MARPQHGGNLVWAADLAGCPLSQILDFSASINPWGPPASAIAAIQARLGDLRDYPDPQYRSLRQALSQFHQIPPEWILPGNGSAELLTWACRDLAALKATTLLTPAFGDYQRALAAFDAQLVTCRLDLTRFQAPTEGQGYGTATQLQVLLRSAAQNASAGLLLNNPHNPTGQLFLRQTLLALLEKFALVVIDEAFMDFLPPAEQQSLLPLIQDYSNLIILRSLTKFYSLAGLRLGYAIAQPERLQRWQQWRDPWPVNSLAVAAARSVLVDHAFQQRTWDWLGKARLQLWQGLSQLPGLRPHWSAANFLLVESRRSSSKLQVQLLKSQQILIRDCLSFPELGDHYFRVAVRSQTDNQRLLEALAQVLSN